MEDEFNAQPIKTVITLSKKDKTLFYLTTFAIRWDSVVSITTAYGLDGPGSTPSRSENFFATVWTSPGAHPSSCTIGIMSLYQA